MGSSHLDIRLKGTQAYTELISKFALLIHVLK